MRRSASLAIAVLVAALIPSTAAAEGAPSAPQDLRASDGWNGVSVYLEWDAPADNGSYPIEQYWIERAVGGDFSLVANLSAWQEDYRDGNVSAHTSYTYRVSAVNAYGPGAPAYVNWTTHGLASAPLNLTATDGSAGVALAWDAPSDAQNFSQYVVYRVVDNDLWWMASLDAAVETFFDDEIAIGETRTYTVAASNEYGPGELAAPVNGTRTNGPPSAPQNFTAGDGWGGVSVVLRWDPPASNGGSPIEGYRLERAQGGDFALIGNFSAGQTQHRDGNVTPHTSYQYRVRAVTGAGPGNAAQTSWTTHDLPSAPQDLSAQNGPDGILLAWSAPASPEGFDAYVIYRVVGGELWWMAAPNASTTTFFDSEIGLGETRTYTVAAENAYGPGPSAPSVDGTRMGEAPSVPRNFSAQDGWGSPAIQLAWIAPEDEGDGPVTGYTLERRNASNDTFVTIAELDDWQTSYHDGNLSENTTYDYRVRARNAFGLGEPALASRTTGAMPSAPRDLTATGEDGGILLSWLPPQAGAGFTAYTIYRVVDGELWWLASQSNAATEYLDEAAAPGETRTYVVAAENHYGNGALSNEATGTRHDLPGAPQNLTASVGLGKINLRWDAPLSNGGSALLSYRIWRGADATNMTLIHEQTASDKDFADVGCGLGAFCYYRVSATNGVGEGPRSEAASAIG